jgi:hypothetical protein
MDIKKLKIAYDLDIKSSLEEKLDKYWLEIDPSGTLGNVLGATYDIIYLCEVAHEIKILSKKRDEHDLESKKYLVSLGEREYIKDEKERGKIPVEWGAEPNWSCISYQDVTMINGGSMKDKEYDIYDTKEVLKVLDQWIEYLVKFYEEQKDLSEWKKNDLETYKLIKEKGIEEARKEKKANFFLKV